MKKLILCILAGALALSLAACNSSESEKTEEETVEEQETAVSETEETQEAEEKQPAGEDAEDEMTEAAETATDEQETAEEEALPDVSAAVEGAETSESKAVPFGSWAKASMYSTQDESFHTVYVRLTKVTTQSKDADYVESAIETNDRFGEAEDVFDEAALEVPEDGELVVLDYEVYVPEDFPAASYGMPEPRFYFSIRNIGGGGIPSTDGAENYLGLGTTVDLVVRDPDEMYEPGHVYDERCIFAMVKGYTNYVAVYSSYPAGTGSGETGLDNLYTVYHAIS